MVDSCRDQFTVKLRCHHHTQQSTNRTGDANAVAGLLKNTGWWKDSGDSKVVIVHGRSLVMNHRGPGVLPKKYDVFSILGLIMPVLLLALSVVNPT